ncbi:MAG: lysophospholipid acyltransferase family protein [Acidimicrobiales bacterium]
MNAELRETALARGDRRSSLVLYRTLRGLLRLVVNPWLRVRSENTEVLDLPGATILAPVHRSNLDSALLATQSSRRIRALGKESLFTTPGVGYVCAALGAIPVRRGEADRDALKAAKSLLDRGETMIVFPEGGRQSGSKITELFDGAAWLAARSGARVIPVGIAGTEAAMPEGAKFIHRSTVAIVPGEPMEPPVTPDGMRVSRQQLQQFTTELGLRLQAAQDRAEALAAG